MLQLIIYIHNKKQGGINNEIYPAFMPIPGGVYLQGRGTKEFFNFV